jgi:hypothetical protein
MVENRNYATTFKAGSHIERFTFWGRGRFVTLSLLYLCLMFIGKSPFMDLCTPGFIVD